MLPGVRKPTAQFNRRAAVKSAALVFDMDGTLVDNMGVHIEVWKLFGRKHGWDVDAPNYADTVGHGTLADVLGRLLGRPATARELAELGDAKEDLYREVYGPRVAPVAGLTELLARAKAAGAKIGMCTNGNQPNVDFIVDRLGIRHYFEAYVVGTDVRRGKPDPECYALAARRLGLPAARCAAFEDSPYGVASAKTAGMAAVGVTTCHFAHELRQADLVIADFTDPRLAAFVGL